MLVGNAEAQSQTLNFQVPFAFSVGDMVLESGSYDARIIANGVLQIRSNDGKAVASVQTQSAYSRTFPDHGKLMFNRYGNEYFLSKIFWPGFEIGREVPQSKNEMLSSVRTAKAATTLSIKMTPSGATKKTGK
jgi:hypothetical protein